MNDSTKRFFDRVEQYVLYRPSYPTAIINYLEDSFELNPTMRIAYIGSGTGISSKLFLDAGYAVTAVEPNDEMRQAAETLLQSYPTFTSIDGKAEETGLAAHSFDLILAGQAFHWFDVKAFKMECKRICKENALVLLCWNERLVNTDFLKAYEELILKYATDYTSIDHRNISDAIIQDFFNPYPFEKKTFPNVQRFDFTGLKGRLLSSSYIPNTNAASYESMINDLQLIYNQYQQNNQVEIHYTTGLYIGRIN
ncbi:MAG: class I SAM-dependent methyltransferase [Bacteroidota bacterium]